jgi:hypothetical protein
MENQQFANGEGESAADNLDHSNTNQPEGDENEEPEVQN